MTKFKGHKTGFNTKGSNDATPNFLGAPTTKFGGRPAVPAGPLKRYPGQVANISSSNRRLAKATHGEGEGSGTNFCGTNAFSTSKAGGSKARTYNTTGGVGSGIRKGTKTP